MSTGTFETSTRYIVPSGNYQKLAELAVGAGLNLQDGQHLSITADFEMGDFVGTVADVAYEAGASGVEVYYFSPVMQAVRARKLRQKHFDVPDMNWHSYRYRELSKPRENGIAAAQLGIVVGGSKDLTKGIDPHRIAKTMPPGKDANRKGMMSGNRNWAMVPLPTEEWAKSVYPDLPAHLAHQKLWDAVYGICRLDADDPAAAWKKRAEELKVAAEKLNNLGIDTLRFQGTELDSNPGVKTDLTVGLLPGSIWKSIESSTKSGVVFLPNLPSEEVFTTPDPMRTNGTVVASMPFYIPDNGTFVDGLVLKFGNGEVTEIHARAGGEVMKKYLDNIDHSKFLGEIALVDNSGRVGRYNTFFGNTLLDENGASHLALGTALPGTFDKRSKNKVNMSRVHLDLMFGQPDMLVTGTTHDGQEIVVMQDGKWRI